MEHNLSSKEQGGRTGLRIQDLDVHNLYVSLVNGCISPKQCNTSG